MLPLSKEDNWVSTQSVSKKEEAWEEPVSTSDVFHPKPYSTSPINIMNSTMILVKWVSKSETPTSTGKKSNKPNKELLLP